MLIYDYNKTFAVKTKETSKLFTLPDCDLPELSNYRLKALKLMKPILLMGQLKNLLMTMKADSKLELLIVTLTKESVLFLEEVIL